MKNLISSTLVIQQKLQNSYSLIQKRIKDYNVTQFYAGAIAQNDIIDGDDIAGGTQDHGSLSKIDAATGINDFSSIISGDGVYLEIDETDGYAVISFPFMNKSFRRFIINFYHDYQYRDIISFFRHLVTFS